MSKVKVSGVLKAVVKGRGGVKVDHRKNTAELEIVNMPAPKQVILPMSQHIGAPCTPTVKVGDTVSVGQVIGDSDKFISAPIHASVSGTVKAIGNVALPNGMVVQGVTIESDGEMRIHEDIKPPKVDTLEEFIKAVRDSGLVGLGGAGFPAHVKLNVPKDKHVDTLIINAAECEPYITVDYRECIENSWDILSGIHIIKDFLGIKSVVIAIENNKPKAFEMLKRIADTDNYSGDAIKIMELEAKYPQGAEKVMVLSATGRKVPPGKLPADVGCLLMNVTSVAFIAKYLKTGMPLVSRALTVDGSAIAEPKNVRVPLGTNISEIIEFCGGFKEEPHKIITGGPMMGLSIVSTDLPVSKSNNAILAFTERDAALTKESDCIRCGRCATACPMSLMPTVIVRHAKAGDAEAVKKAGVMVCMECGSCSYSCPAKKPLVQNMRAAKALVREAGAKK